MAINYSGVTIGTLTLCQERRDGNGIVTDEKGRPVINKFKLQIRASNCFAVFLYIRKEKEPEDPRRPWIHTLVSFFGNEQHLKNCLKENGSFEYWLGGKLANIKLNVYYPEMEKLAKYMAKSGLNVGVYYKRPKE